MNGRQVQWLVVLITLVNATGLMTPVINQGDSVTYASLAQQMVVHGDWARLVLDGQDWLDKPHFPFWVGALFFKLLGISAFSYILPGFLFHLLAGYYTYRMARLFYSKDAAWLALLVYMSVYHIMASSIEVRAEAFLTGSIMGACYYWLRYDATSRIKHLLLAAIFSATAVMTKGVFTLITIGGGLVCMWLYLGQWQKLFSLKWFTALLLTCVCTAPELLALYVQFDLNTPQQVYANTDVSKPLSGIQFFVWDSQFGRFFNTGPIKNTAGNPAYFLHVFVWAFLPWVAVYLASLFKDLRHFFTRKTAETEKPPFVFLFTSFYITFALFSATSFQLDYYTVIVFPFAAIACGRYLSGCLDAPAGHSKLLLAQGLICLLMVALSIGIAWYTENTLVLVGAVAMVLATLAYAYQKRSDWRFQVLLVVPVCAVAVFYLVMSVLVTLTYLKVAPALNASKVLQQQPPAPVFVLDMEIAGRELALYTPNPCTTIYDPAKLPAGKEPYYLMVRGLQLANLPAPAGGRWEPVAQAQWAIDKTGTLPRMLRLAKGVEPLDDVRIVRFVPG